MVIPVHDVNPVRRTPYVTYALIAANFVVFLATPGVASSLTGESGPAQLCHLQAFLDHWAAVPRELIHGQTPTTVPTGHVGVGPQGAGCLVGPPGYDKSPPVSVLTAMFLHSSWLHLLGNMLFLMIFGNNIEDRLGHIRYVLFYVVCGYAAAYGFALVNADSGDPLIGASGAIMRRPGRVSGALPEGQGLGPRPVPDLPAAAPARVDRAGLLVRPPGGVLVRHRRLGGRHRGVRGPRRRLPGRHAPRLAPTPRHATPTGTPRAPVGQTSAPALVSAD